MDILSLLLGIVYPQVDILYPMVDTEYLLGGSLFQLRDIQSVESDILNMLVDN